MSLVGGSFAKKTVDKSPLFHALVAERPTTVGELVDFADSVPLERVSSIAALLALTVINDYRWRRRPNRRRRRLIILGVLLTRLAFEHEHIPRDRDALV